MSKVEYEEWDVTIGDLKGKFEREELIPDPDWQRGYIWKTKDEKLLIDSIMKNLPIPKFYLTLDFHHITSLEIHYVIDGQQRITAINRFLNNKFSVDLGGQEFYFNELDTAVRQQILRYRLNGHTLLDYGQKDINFLFKRLNSTGMKLSNMEEWNNEYYNTPILKLVKNIFENSKSKTYIHVVYTEENIKRMVPQDDIVDLLNCIISEDIEGGSKRILENFLKNNKDIKDDIIEKHLKRFVRIVDTLFKVLPRKNLTDSLFSKRTHFISLFLALNKTLDVCKITKNKSILQKKLLTFINNQPEKYRESVLGGIRSKSQRETRVSLLEGVIVETCSAL